MNFIHSLPYLQVIELTFIALPLAVHIWWGIERIHMARVNSIPSDGTSPSLPYSRNIAYTWQRITSVLLIIAIGLHVYYMRFAKEPESVSYGLSSTYFVKVTKDPGIYTLAPRLNLMLYDHAQIDKAKPEDEIDQKRITLMKELRPGKGDLVAMCDSFGTALLMMVRDTFKSIWLCTLYSIFVVIAAFHGCNGLWTFAITWGISLSERGRHIVRIGSNVLMGLLIFLGLVSIWGVYWINLRF